jgi:addiction module RelE/StbE family toxin
MAVEVVFSPQARLDLIDIGDYIARDNPEAAARWVDMLVARCRSLIHFPNRGRRYKGPYRVLPVRNYLIFYRADGEGVVIVRVLHGSRNIEGLLGQ